MTIPGAKTAAATRTEHDLLGDRDVPADAYYGVQTLRAQENFHITGVPLTTSPGSSKRSLTSSGPRPAPTTPGRAR